MAKNPGLGQHPGRIKALEDRLSRHQSWYDQHCKPCE
jgi:hypothetical protein